jgi:hypothetical protein
MVNLVNLTQGLSCLCSKLSGEFHPVWVPEASRFELLSRAGQGLSFPSTCKLVCHNFKDRRHKTPDLETENLLHTFVCQFTELQVPQGNVRGQVSLHYICPVGEETLRPHSIHRKSVCLPFTTEGDALSDHGSELCLYLTRQESLSLYPKAVCSTASLGGSDKGSQWRCLQVCRS